MNASFHYDIRVAGHLDQHWSPWFCGMTITPEDDGTTTLRGWVRDQAALHGLLATVRDIGVPLLSVTATDPIGHGKFDFRTASAEGDGKDSPAEATLS